MRSLDELISRFKDIRDLPVSEELLGVYVEGNLRGSELREVSNLLRTDDNFSNLVQSVESDGINSDFDSIGSWDLLDFAGITKHDHNNIGQIELPPIEQVCMPLDQSVNDVICIANDYLSDAMHIAGDNNDHQGNDSNLNDSFDESTITDNFDI